MNFDSPLESIPRISPVYRKKLNKLGIKNLRDLFYHFPHRYDDFSNTKPIGEIKLNEIVTVQGKIIEIKNIQTWRKRMFVTEVYIQDKSGAIRAVWFNQPFLINTLKQGQFVSLSGKVYPVRDFTKSPQGKREQLKISNGVNFDKTLYLSNPAYEKIASADSKQLTVNNELKHTGRLVAVYPETAGISSRWLRYIIKIFLPKFLPQIKDYLPPEIKRGQGLLDLNRALEQIHFPKTKKYAAAARRRLAFDELFLIQLSALRQKMKWQTQGALKIAFNQLLIKNFVESLPFKLTSAQRKAGWEILQDLEKSKPMNRLLEGDVGSGKTVVAAIGALQAVSAGCQVALMAPTEILAQQHFKTIIELLKDQNITIGLLTGSATVIASDDAKLAEERGNPGQLPPSTGLLRRSTPRNDARKEFLKKVSSGQIQILIGTHALIQENVKFKNLAFVVVDEQHRFGVSQRAALQKNITEIKDGSSQTIPHLLSMTATPIPRTLALTIYGDLDISLLDEMPADRQEIITKIVSPANRQKAYEFIRQQVKEGRQVFVICPRIEIANKHESATDITNQNSNDNIREIRGAFVDISDVKAVKQEYEKLHRIIFSDLRISMLHGKLKPKEKEKIMSDFKQGETDILVSTSVVEVGIDIPNATVMMIEGADRFGLAQLHQFRGRVGRGPHQSYCFLFTESAGKNTSARLKALATCKNGFELAEKDLAIRGPGEFYGTRQWGLPDLSMASLADMPLVKAVRQEAQKFIQKDPELKNYPLLKEKLKEFQTTLHLE